MQCIPTRCGVRTHASIQRPDLKSGALNHSANLVHIYPCQGKKANGKLVKKPTFDMFVLLKKLLKEICNCFCYKCQRYSS